MVPGPRIRESRSPLDSRPPRGKPPGGLFFCAPFRLAATLSRPRLVNTSRLSLTGPLPRRLGASSFLRAAARAGVLPGLRRGARSRHHGRSIPAALGSQPPRGKSSRGPFFFCTRARSPASPTHPPQRHPERTLPRRIRCIVSCAVALEGERRPIGPTLSRRLISAARAQYPFEINFPGSLKLQL